MKLSTIYSNKDQLFTPIEFNDGLNVVLGQIRLPENRDKDTHNLGKSKLAELINFCLLKTRHKAQFLFKHFEKFEHFVFFLEIKLNSGSYVTIRRSVSKNTKICINRHKDKWQNFRHLDNSEWDYVDITLDKAKLILDEFIGLAAMQSSDYRHAVNYSLRSQNDFSDVFKLGNFRGRHIHWKPYIGNILGFEADFLVENYELKEKLDSLSERIKKQVIKLGSFLGDEEEMLIELLSLKEKNADELQQQLDSFNFDKADADHVRKLTDELDQEISDLNKFRYYIAHNIKKFRNSLKQKKLNFDISQTEKMFKEAGVMFGDGVRRSYEELVEFNKKISFERQALVKEQIDKLEKDLAEAEQQLKGLNKEKSSQLKFLSNADTFKKYKGITEDLISLRTEINEVNKKLEVSVNLKQLREEEQLLESKKKSIIGEIGNNRDLVIKDESSIYRDIKTNFTGFIKEVLNKNGTISTKQNSEGNLEFFAGLVNHDGDFTSEDDGHSYKKILCIAYDLAVNKAYKSQNFIRFTYHDGGLETLDERKKYQFLNYVKNYTDEFDLQYILTVIDTDLPNDFLFKESEIVCHLHDDGEDGLLFKMPSW